MQSVNPAAAAALIRDVENHLVVFLDEWRYDVVSRFTKADLDAAWNALLDATSPRGHVFTRFVETFRGHGATPVRRVAANRLQAMPSGGLVKRR